MADYFALLGEKRRPYLDPDRVTETFHELSRSQHPDQQAARDGGESDFALLNQAQQTLRDPKLRLACLLSLEYPGVRLTGPSEVPRELANLLTPVHALLGQVNALLARRGAAPSALARALLAREELQLRAQVEAQLHTLNQLQAGALAELQEYDCEWRPGMADGQQSLLGFYLRFSYLSRWIDQLRELLFQLAQ